MSVARRAVDRIQSGESLDTVFGRLYGSGRELTDEAKAQAHGRHNEIVGSTKLKIGDGGKHDVLVADGKYEPVQLDVQVGARRVPLLRLEIPTPGSRKGEKIAAYSPSRRATDRRTNSYVFRAVGRPTNDRFSVVRWSLWTAPHRDDEYPVYGDSEGQVSTKVGDLDPSDRMRLTVVAKDIALCLRAGEQMLEGRPTGDVLNDLAQKQRDLLPGMAPERQEAS